MTHDVDSNQPGCYSHHYGDLGVAEHREQHDRYKSGGSKGQPGYELVDLHDVLL